ncbi:hypothetical protein ABZV77_05700 [Streptomyces sp. NPDC004732]|uniref:hypothetical protein n=1 Tax=Streptomyces sp. NPDC004732 TaxID=3154290 RepID=UPI0033BDDD3C
MPTSSTEIILSTSRPLGLVGIASGENYEQANQALEAAGFSRLSNGAYTASLADDQAARRTASTLVAHAHENGATIVTSPRRYLGDIGTDIAARLPGTWSAQLEIYSLPLWQEDLWYGLWEAGEIYRALEVHRVPYASVLKDGKGTELLLVERPGHSSGYLLGALTDHEKEDVRDDPTTPPSMVLPAEPDQAASAITHTFLPAYQRALHHRDLNTVLSALERIREEHQSFQLIKSSGRYTAGVPLSSRLIDSMERAFADHAWISYRVVLEHAPELLARCQPATTPWPEDAAALIRLRAALADSEEAWHESNTLSSDLHAIPRTLHTHEWSHVRAQLGLAALPAIETWLTDSDVFERQARAAAPDEQAALSAASPRMLTARPTPLPAPRAATTHR